MRGDNCLNPAITTGIKTESSDLSIGIGLITDNLQNGNTSVNIQSGKAVFAKLPLNPL